MTKRRVLELIPVLGSQLAGDMSHKPCGKNVKKRKKTLVFASTVLLRRFDSYCVKNITH